MPRWEMLTSVKGDDGTRRWFIAAREAPCVGNDPIEQWVGFRLVQRRRLPLPSGAVLVICEPVAPHLLNCLLENGFREIRQPPPEAESELENG